MNITECFRHCEQCGSRFSKRGNELIGNFHKRRFCSRDCRQENSASLCHLPSEEEIYGDGGLAEQIRAERKNGMPEDRAAMEYTIPRCTSTIARVLRKKVGQSHD
jgi:hypothetical protein